MAALLVIEDRSEDTRRVESGQAQPVYSPVRADQSGGVQVTYDPVIFYGEIAHASSPPVPTLLPTLCPYGPRTAKTPMGTGKP